MSQGITYSQWIEEHRSTLQGFVGKQVLLLFSGGKDSSVCMHLIAKATGEFGFSFEAHAGAYPVHRYADPEKAKLDAFWKKRGVQILWHTIKETDAELEKASNPCLVCQKARKAMLHTLLSESVEDWESLVVIVSYTLWDIVSYSVERILGHVFSSGDTKGLDLKDHHRFTETAQRFYPALKMKEGYMVFRPLLRYNRDDILQALGEENIPFLSTPCRYKEWRPKRVLEKYYKEMGIRFHYDRVLQFAQNALDLPEIALCQGTDKEGYFKKIF
jgi:tRNA(Ile)-lysidine synthase TilS/MesJ